MYTILYFLDYGQSFGGAAGTLFRQAMLMKEKGNRVILFFSDYLGRGIEKECQTVYSRYEQYGIEVNYATYQISSQPEDIDVICMDENYEKLKEKIQAFKPDILHSVQLNPLVELIGRELDIPHIMNIYPLLPEFFSPPYMNIFPHYHICDSWYWAERWNQYLDTDFTCIRTAVKTREGYGEGDTPERRESVYIRYICAGSVYKGKNQLGVIQAFHEALKRGVKGELFIYGYDSSTYAEECRRYVEKHDLAGSIRMKGFCADMESVYRGSDVLICGSARESYPNVISEAMAYGLAVIATPAGGVPELVKDGINGYLAENGSPEALCRKILELNQDMGKERLEMIKRNAHETFVQNHSSDAVSEKLLAYYQHVIQDNKKRTDIGIRDVRERFAAWKNIFYRNISYFTEPQRAAAKIWYLSYIKDSIGEALQRESGFYIWGTGKYGKIVKEIIDIFLPEIKICGFLDSNRDGFYLEHNIYNPNQILEKKGVVIFIAAVNGQDEMIDRLEKKGMVFHQDYFILSPRKW